METFVYSYHPVFKTYYNYITRKTTEFVVYTYIYTKLSHNSWVLIMSTMAVRTENNWAEVNNMNTFYRDKFCTFSWEENLYINQSFLITLMRAVYLHLNRAESVFHWALKKTTLVNKCWESFSSISLPSIPKISNWNVECSTVCMW
jgi:hypothetical protein